LVIGDNVAKKKKTGVRGGARRTSEDDTLTREQREQRVTLDTEFMRVGFIERALGVGRDGGFNLMKWTPYVLQKAGYTAQQINDFYPSAQLGADEEKKVEAPVEETAAAL
jgi:hypothetical protein